MLSKRLSPNVTLITPAKNSPTVHTSSRLNDRDPDTLCTIDTCRGALFLSPLLQSGVRWDVAYVSCQHDSTQGFGMKSGRISPCPVETVKNLTQNRSWGFNSWLAEKFYFSTECWLLVCWLLAGFSLLSYKNLLILWFNFPYSRFGYRADKEPRHGVCRVRYRVLCFILSWMDNVVAALKAELCVLHQGVVCLSQYLHRAVRYPAADLCSSFPGGSETRRFKIRILGKG